MIKSNVLTGGKVFNRLPSNHNSVRFGRDPTMSGYVNKNQQINQEHQSTKNCLVREISSALLTGNCFCND